MILPAPARTLYLVRGLQGPRGRAGSLRRAPTRTLRMLRTLRGLGDAASDAAAADAARGGAGYPQVAICPWAADNSYSSDPAGQILLAYVGPSYASASSGTMYADSWANLINYYQVPGDQMWSPNTVSPAAKAALAGRKAPGNSDLGLTAGQLGCPLPMELTLGQYWAAFKSYNAGTWKPPGAVCGPSNPQYGPSSTLLYPNVNVSATWSGNAAPASQAAAAATQAAGGTGSLVFSTPHNGGPLYPGDAWTIKISGAAPNSPVAVTGNSSPATYGTNVTTPMGTTDASGNWSLSGKIDASSIGQWYENWSVAGNSVGSFSFQVVASAPVANGAQGPAPAPAGSVPTGGAAAVTTAASVIPGWFTDTTIDGIPNWLLCLGAVGVGWFLLKGKM